MNIVVAFKVVCDDQDIVIAEDGSLDRSKARQVVSAYDLNAIEAAAQLASKVEGSSVTAVSVSAAAANDSKLKKNVLARGVDELYLTADDAFVGLDTHNSAQALKALLARVGQWDVIICGDGSADDYCQQVDVQLAELLGVPVVNGVMDIVAENDQLIVRRCLESIVETVQVPTPAVVAVSPDIAPPRICGMKDILAAGKKPSEIVEAGELDTEMLQSLEVLSILAPEQVERRGEVFQLSTEGDLTKFVSSVVEVVR